MDQTHLFFPMSLLKEHGSTGQFVTPSGRYKFIRDTTYILGSICSIHMTSVDFDEPGFLFLFHIYLLIFQNGSSVMIDVATGGRSHHQNEQVR